MCLSSRVSSLSPSCYSTRARRPSLTLVIHLHPSQRLIAQLLMLVFFVTVPARRKVYGCDSWIVVRLFISLTVLLFNRARSLSSSPLLLVARFSKCDGWVQ
ncbi:hypothetical protein SESBI_48588 [Sesbania bispinosa]|nr:hypothetical protein SESBI_48588 [Sesbania bispinosa]